MLVFNDDGMAKENKCKCVFKKMCNGAVNHRLVKFCVIYVKLMLIVLILSRLMAHLSKCESLNDHSKSQIRSYKFITFKI